MIDLILVGAYRDNLAFAPVANRYSNSLGNSESDGYARGMNAIDMVIAGF